MEAQMNGRQFARLLQAGCRKLQSQAQQINDLNVFPIPDGDTGDNMLLTLTGGVEALGEGCESLGEAAQRAADGMLLSARGNSGVILSQIFAGLAQGLSGAQTADSEGLLAALREGVAHAYRAVLEPTEGTMLTVLRCSVERTASEAHTPEEVLQCLLEQAQEVLSRTPEMLPVLKHAGVVDSGGAGLVCLLSGMTEALTGQELPPLQTAPARTAETLDLSRFTEDSVLEYGYCTELLVRLQRCKTDLEHFCLDELNRALGALGDSLVAVQTGSIVKIHIHTMTPDRVLALLQGYGEFLKIKIENMSLQHNSLLPEPPRGSRKPFAVVAVAAGEGIRRLFAERGADVVLDGGQSHNPSAEEFLAAFAEANAETIFVLPNNGNIVLAACQAAGLWRGGDVRVLESHTIGAGYAALSMLSLDSGNADEIEAELTQAMQGVVTAGVSRSVRSTQQVRSGQYIGFVGKDILAAHDSRLAAACETFERLKKQSFDVCLILWGAQAEQTEAQQLAAHIGAACPGREVYALSGGQEVYDYLLILQ